MLTTHGRRLASMLAASALGVAFTPTAHASGSQPACGATVTMSVRLTADLSGCDGVGLQVGADGVTIDLAGHAIRGTATTGDGSVGVLVRGHDGVVVTRGAVSGFTEGIVLADSSQDEVTHMSVHGNRDKGVVLASATHSSVVHDRISRNDDAAVGVFSGADHNLVGHNTMRANGPQGVEVLFSSGTAIAHNLITDTGSGVILESADDTTITKNRILRSVATACDGCGIGIQIYGNDNLVSANTIVDAPRYGIEVDDFMDPGHSPAVDNVIRSNVVHRAGEGIAVGPEAGGVVLRTLIDHNRVSNAADDGIQLVGPSTGLETSTLSRNLAVHNGNWGINAVAGVNDGGGNVAAGNGNPAQCRNISCRGPAGGSAVSRTLTRPEHATIAIHHTVFFTKTLDDDAQAIYRVAGHRQHRITDYGAFCCVLRVSTTQRRLLVFPTTDQPLPVTGGTLRLDGTGFQRQPLPDATLNLIPNAWSPDGRRVACLGWDDSDASRRGLYTMRTDGTHLQRVTVRPGDLDDVPLDYSPDGRWIVFYRSAHPDPDPHTDGALWVVRTDGSHAHRITTRRRPPADSARWSPDGTRIVYADQRTAADGAVWTVHPDGTHRRMIFDGSAHRFPISPVWSPHGHRILFALDPDNDAFTHPDNQLWTMSPDGRGLRLVDDTPDFKSSMDWVDLGQ